MSQRIRILAESLTNKIAAGEVVERPSSVVKELVENSLDAGCTDVVVEIEGGGKRLIKIGDDGCGMSREDGLLALERHATSKIGTAEDLSSLMTLGFRGEALPSIASVSRFTLATRERGTLEGTEIYVEGGRVRDVKACGMAEGTLISVRNVFFNVPARLKFMKSTETETGHVGEILMRLALSRPDVRFTYVSDGKTMFRVPPGELRTRVGALFGEALAGALYPLDYAVGEIKFKGMVSRPDCSRSAPSHLVTYINGRFIKDRVVQHAVLQAYRGQMERGRYPVAVLFLEMPGSEVDVNVHPTKHEVRFREQGKVHDVLVAAIESVLLATPWLKSVQPVAAPSSNVETVTGERLHEVREVLTHYGATMAQVSAFPRHVLPERQSPHSTDAPEVIHPLLGPSTGYYSSLTVIGQLNAAYIVCQDGADLVIIDQHAAHERIAFEQLKTDCATGSVESQGLLFPETIDLSPREVAAANDFRAELDHLGFDLEPFGGSTWIMKRIPRILAGRDWLRILRDLLEEFQGVGRSRSFIDVQEGVLARLACHSVVRGPHPLTSVEMVELLRRMDRVDRAGTCPHGRPVLFKMTLHEIEKMFRRS